MSSPVVDRVRTVPLIVEQGIHKHNIPMEVEEISGFPFDRENTSDRDAHFRSQLDDIAKRHPEFAEHLGNLRTGNSGVRRQSSLGGADEPDFANHRRFQRPFGSRFERFGFPFDGDDFDPEKYAQQFYKPYEEEFHQQQPAGHGQPQQPPGYTQQQSSGYSPQPSGYTQPQPSGYSQPQPSGYSQPQPSGYSPQPSAYSPQHQQPEPEYAQPDNTESTAPDPERVHNIQQSNTVDLGQKQEPVNDRSQRSMSAPPPEKGQRFTSSINIPVNQPEQGGDDMAQTQQQSNAKTTERIIPIHVEDRDEPVLPRKGAPAYAQQHSTFGGSPQPETIFGRRPEEFTHFVNREPRQYEKWHSGFNHPDEFVRQQRFPQQQVPPQQPVPKPQPQQPKGDIPIPVQVEVPHTKQKASQRAASPQAPQQQQQQQQQAPPQPPKPAPPQQKKPLTPLEQIQAILADVAGLAAQVEKFDGKPRDKKYLYLDEMLTRNLLKLDNVDTQGQDDIRTARKEAIKSIEKTIGVLESRAAGNVQPQKEEQMEVEVKTEDEKKEDGAMEVAAEACNKSESQQPMEVVPENSGNTEVQGDEKSGCEGPKIEAQAQDSVPAENRAVLVENKPEIVENRAVLVEKPEAEEAKMETCEGQDSNLAVADAVKKFEGAEKDKVEGNEAEGVKESSQEGGEAKVEDKKAKKKGKKKVEKKEK